MVEAPMMEASMVEASMVEASMVEAPRAGDKKVEADKKVKRKLTEETAAQGGDGGKRRRQEGKSSVGCPLAPTTCPAAEEERGQTDKAQADKGLTFETKDKACGKRTLAEREAREGEGTRQEEREASSSSSTSAFHTCSVTQSTQSTQGMEKEKEKEGTTGVKRVREVAANKPANKSSLAKQVADERRREAKQSAAAKGD